MNRVKAFAHRSVVLQIFNPIIRLLQIGGVTVGPTIRDESLEEDGSLESRVFKVGIGQWMYSTVVVFFMWTFAAGYLHKLVFLTPLTSPWVITFMYFIFLLCGNLCLTLSCLKYHRGSFHTFVRQCYAYEQTYDISEKSAKLVLGVRITVVSFFPLALGMMVSFIYLHSLDDELEKQYLAFERPAWINYPFVCVEVWVSILINLGVMLSIVITSMLLYNELDVVSNNFKTFVTNETINIPKLSEKRVTDLIQRHKKLCTLIATYSENNSYYVFVSLFLSLPLFCFTVYILLTTHLSSYAAGLCYSMLDLCLLPSSVLLLLGSRLNVKAHQPMTYLWQIPTSELAEEAMRELMLFCARLTSTSIGFNMYGLFVINPPILLTIVGTVVTYFVVVLQFKPSGSHTCDDILANITTLLQDMSNNTTPT